MTNPYILYDGLGVLSDKLGATADETIQWAINFVLANIEALEEAIESEDE